MGKQATSLNRDAMILIPGLFHKPGEALKVASQKIAWALDKQATSANAKFLLDPGKEEAYQGNRVPMATIVRKDASKETFSIDLYEMSYADVLVAQYRDRKPILQALQTGLLLVLAVPMLIKAFTNRSKTFSEKIHIFYAGGLLLLAVVYMILLLITATATLSQPLVAEIGADSGEAIKRIQGVYDYLLPYLTGFIIVGTALGLFTTKSMKQAISNISVWIMSALHYLRLRGRKSALTGQVSSLLEYVTEKDNSYRKVHIIAYSFGSIIAIDALFPDETSPPQRSRFVDTLVTIGCPYDFIRTFWDGYFEQRNALSGTPRKWLNVYAAADVLASNFRDEKKPISPKELLNTTIPYLSKPKDEDELRPRGIGLTKNNKPKIPTSIRFGKDKSVEDHTLLEQLTLIGFKVHASYWGDREPFARSCFDSIVENMYKKDLVLS